MINKEIRKLMEKRDNFINVHDFSKYSLETVENTIGKDLTEKLVDLFEKENTIIRWFYSPSPPLNGKTPNEYYKENPKELENLINRYSSGDFSF